MTYDEIINEVENGAKFTINFQKRTCRVNGKVAMSEEDKPKDTPYLTPEVVFVGIEQRYAAYKHSVPSEHSDSTSAATYRTNGILTRCARLLASIRIPSSWRSRRCSMCVTSTLMRAT